MKKDAPTLIDELYRMSFHKERHKGWNSNSEMRAALRDARRFVLDDRMSSFLADLATAAFVIEPGRPLADTKRSHMLIEQMRTSARLPHKSTWIEYNMFAELNRNAQLLGRPPRRKGECPDKEGWLLRQHPAIETAFSAHLFSFCYEPDPEGYDLYTFPVAYTWTTDDSPLPWFQVLPDMTSDDGQSFSPSAICTGFPNYVSPHVNVTVMPPGRLENVPAEAVGEIIAEWSGTMRRIWALLATINDIPTTHRSTSISKGFVARGSYHKFLEHKVITLNVPDTRDMRKLARSIVAVVRRRAHQVRGHWRKDYRHPGGRLWVHEHVRGDASLGFVTHDYNVEHPKEKDRT
jgi:hypothetical protein